jgi:hypothetical protein
MLQHAVLGAEPNWAPEWKAGLEEAKERNCPVIIVAPFKRGTFQPSVFPNVFNDSEVIKFCNRFVCFFADDKRFPKVDTIYAAKYVKPDSGKYGSLQVILCKPDGTEVDKLRLTGSVPKGKLLDNMKRILKSYPSVITKAQYESCKALKEKAELLHILGAYAEAIKTYEELAKKKIKLKFVKEAKDKPKELKKEAAEKVEEAAKALSGDDAEKKKEAIKNLHTYNYGMKGLKVKSTGDPKKTLPQRIRDLLAEARKDGALRADYNSALKDAKALEKYIQAETAYLAGNYKKAMKAYKKIIRTYDETEYYDMAKSRIQEIIEKLTPKKDSTTP